MAFGLPKDQRSQIMLVLVIAALAGGYGFWEYVRKPKQERIAQLAHDIDSLQAEVNKAKQELAGGTVEQLRQRVEEYGATLDLMRRLVPERNEVPTLIDEISTRSKIRGVNIAQFQPQAVESGAPFDTYRYRMAVLGRYDEVGEFLSDVASLARIVVPYDITLAPATAAGQKAVGDTTGGLLEVKFAVRTYVKTPAPARDTSGTR